MDKHCCTVLQISFIGVKTFNNLKHTLPLPFKNPFVQWKVSIDIRRFSWNRICQLTFISRSVDFRAIGILAILDKLLKFLYVCQLLLSLHIIPGKDVEVRVLLVSYHLRKDSMFMQKSHGTIRILLISKSGNLKLKMIFPTGTL